MKRLNQYEFIERCNISHGDKFKYHKTKYLNSMSKITITCDKHGDFEILPKNHLYLNQGCYKCSQENRKLSIISSERLESMKAIHNNRYLYNDISVSNGKIKIICPIHNEFTQSIYHHENGHGCYNCEKESRIKIRQKTCISCNLQKMKSNFSPRHRICKDCFENKVSPENKTCNQCISTRPVSEFYVRKESKDGHRNECKVCFNSLRVGPRKIYKKKNRKSLQEKDMIYRKERMKNDPFYRSKTDARNIVRKALREKGYSKNSKTETILGCSFIEFKKHIESLFLPNMIWENRNEWHIDHIIPLGFAVNESEIIKLNHYKNLRPIWIVDNLSKSNNITIMSDLYYEIINERELNLIN